MSILVQTANHMEYNYN